MPKLTHEKSRTLDRSVGAVAPRRWEGAIRDAMFQLTNDELAGFLASDSEVARRLEACLKRARALARSKL